MYRGQQGISFGLTDDPLFFYQWLGQRESELDAQRRQCAGQEAQRGQQSQHEYAVISPLLPLWLAELALKAARNAALKSRGTCQSQGQSPSPGPDSSPGPSAALSRKTRSRAASAIKKVLGQWDIHFSGYLPDYGFDRVGGAITDVLLQTRGIVSPLPDQDALTEFWAILSARVLLAEEALGEIRKRQRSADERVLKALALSGKATAAAAVGIGEFGRPVCRRCGERTRIIYQYCPHCGRQCFLCLACVSMGEARSCKTLYTFVPFTPAVPQQQATQQQAPQQQTPQQQAPPSAKLLEPILSVQLTAAQQQAARELTQLFKEGCREALVWAVCGAGKTEVAFDVMAAALNAGLRILYTVPRRDVVRELAPRIRAAFGQETVTELPLSGGGPLPGTPMLISTTHQVLRFADAFDLVILDEADAFPYYGSEMLYRGLQRARGRNAMLTYMTATPDGALRKQVSLRKIGVIRIPARHHGHPLAVPSVHRVKESEWTGMPGNLPNAVQEFLEESLRRNAVVLVFVPTVRDVELTGQALAEFGARHGIASDYLHSGRAERALIVTRFRERSIRLLASTTLLERGITVPFTDVAVLRADHRIFDARVLVQMSGRAGRDRSDPVGRVAFFGSTVSGEMQQALAMIIGMNEEAGKRGYLQQL